MNSEELIGRDRDAGVARNVATEGAAQRQQTSPSIVQVFDKPMCCSTGICGPAIDPTLVRFAADLDYLRRQGVQADRFNLSQQPDAFSRHADVLSLVSTFGVNVLPIIRVDGRVVSQRVYPGLEQLAAWTHVHVGKSSNPDPLSILPSGCCSAE